MGVQFGRWNFDGMPPAPEYLARAEKLLIPYGPDGRGSCFREGASLLYFDFDVTNESGQITQPHTLKSGAVIAWDGRLDNRDELVRQLRGDLTNESADVLIVGTAYEHWGIECLARLLGDWPFPFGIRCDGRSRWQKTQSERIHSIIHAKADTSPGARYLSR